MSLLPKSVPDPKKKEFDRILELMESDNEEEVDKEPGWKNLDMEPLQTKEMQEADSDGEATPSNEVLLKWLMKLAENMETNQRKIEKGVACTIKETVKTEVKEKSTKLKTSIAEYLGNEMAEMKSHLQKSLDKMQDQISSKIISTSIMDAKINKYQETLSFFNKRYEDHEEWRKSVERNDKERVETFNKVLDKVNSREEKDAEYEEALLEVDRKWRRYNTRISNLKDYNKADNVKETVAKFVIEKKLLQGYTKVSDVRNEIETAYRVGKQWNNKPKQILCRFYCYEVRDEIMRRAKQSQKAEEIKPVYLQDDLNPKDLELKNEANAFMKKAHTKKKFPRFYKGTVKISENGDKLEIPRTDILDFNKKHNIVVQKSGKEKSEPTKKTDEIPHIKPISSPKEQRVPKSRTGGKKSTKETATSEQPKKQDPKPHISMKDKEPATKPNKPRRPILLDSSEEDETPILPETEAVEQEDNQNVSSEEIAVQQMKKSTKKIAILSSDSSDAEEGMETPKKGKKDGDEDESIEELSASIVKLKGIINDSQLMTKKMKRDMEMRKQRMAKLLELSPEPSTSDK